MFNIDPEALAAQVAAKTEKEKFAFLKYFNLIYNPEGPCREDIYNMMIGDPDIGVQSFVAFVIFVSA